jgi:hypothetical protein
MASELNQITEQILRSKFHQSIFGVHVVIVGDEPKASHEGMAAAIPASWARTNGGCSRGLCSLVGILLCFHRDSESFLGHGTEA